MKRRRPALGREFGLLCLLVVIIAGFAAFSSDFRDPYNLLDRTRHWVEIGLIAVPMTLIIATGGIDLSVGSLLALCAIVSGLAFAELRLPLPLALLCGIAAGGLGGALNGTIISRLKVPPLVVTLATMAMFRGIAMGISHANPIRDFPDWFTSWGSLDTFGVGNFQLPYVTLVLLVVVVIGDFIMRRTCVGRWATQIGENPKAASYAAVPIGRVQLGLYCACGLVCGLAAVTSMARFATAHPASGAGLELEAIACVVIGGTRITGGNGSVLGTFLGTAILGILRFGMDMMGTVQQHQIILIGIMVIAMAILNEHLARRQRAVVRTTKAKHLS